MRWMLLCCGLAVLFILGNSASSDDAHKTRCNTNELVRALVDGLAADEQWVTDDAGIQGTYPLPGSGWEKAMVAIGDDAVPELLKCLGDHNPKVRIAAASMLCRINDVPEARTALFQFLKNSKNYAVCDCIRRSMMERILEQEAIQGIWQDRENKLNTFLFRGDKVTCLADATRIEMRFKLDTRTRPHKLTFTEIGSPTKEKSGPAFWGKGSHDLAFCKLQGDQLELIWIVDDVALHCHLVRMLP